MKYRTIGTDQKNRREVSVLSLGAMLFARSPTNPPRSRSSTATSKPWHLHRHIQQLRLLDQRHAGRESEELIGRWRRSRGIGTEVVIANQARRPPLAPGTGYLDNAEGLSPQ